MNETTTGIVLFGTLVLICSFLAHALQRRFWLAVTLASLASAVLFQVAVFFQLGYLDPFMPVAMVITLVISALCACIVGAGFLLFRNKNHLKTSQQAHGKDPT